MPPPEQAAGSINQRGGSKHHQARLAQVLRQVSFMQPRDGEAAAFGWLSQPVINIQQEMAVLVSMTETYLIGEACGGLPPSVKPLGMHGGGGALVGGND